MAEEFELAALDEDRSCGYSFVITDGDERRSLVIEVRASARSSGSYPIGLGEPLIGHVRVGRNLFSGSCTDVSLGPTPVIDERWPLVAGTGALSVDEPVPATDGRATLTVTGLVARMPGGREVVLGDVEITSDHWAEIAG